MNNLIAIVTAIYNMILTVALLYFIIRHAKEWRKVKREIRIVRKAVIRIMLEKPYHFGDVLETFHLQKWFNYDWSEAHDTPYIDRLVKYKTTQLHKYIQNLMTSKEEADLEDME